MLGSRSTRRGIANFSAREARGLRGAGGGRSGPLSGSAHAKQLDLDSPIGLQALHQAAIGALVGAEAVAIGDWFGTAAAGGLDRAGAGARLEVSLDRFGTFLGE